MLLAKVAAFLLAFAVPKFNAYDYHERLEEMISTSIQDSLDYTFPTNASEFMPDSDDIEDLEDVDFIIVGAGASGSILAKRLSEVGQWYTLILEAGTYREEFLSIPAMQPYLLRSKYNWGFRSTPQKTVCASYPGHVCPVPRGKAIGGTTAINGLRYVRGNKKDFDYWASLGNPGWEYKYSLPYFKKTENAKMDDIDIEYHGFEGPLQSEHHQPLTEIEEHIIDGNIQLGTEYVDFNGKKQTGVSRSQQNTRKGIRQSTGDLMDLETSNLNILDKSYVIKVLIDESTKIASGVIFSFYNKLYRVKARKEVILSAGAISTPQLLMLSGIGPADHLNQLGIEVIENLSVGKNLVDHITLYGIFFNTNMTEELKTIREYLEEYDKGLGQYTVATGTTVLAYLESSLAQQGYPDIELYLRPPFPVVNYTRKLRGYTDEAYDGLYKNMDRLSAIEADVILLHPKSRGTVELTSTNPYVYPTIDFNFFSDPDGEDMKIVLEGINYVISLLETPAFKKMNASLVDYAIPACLGLEYLSDDYWKCILEYYGYIGHHTFGTCRMGPDPTKGDVVDSKLKVHGIKNLRVVDASVLPKISGHTAAPSMMIAEKISDVIKLEHGIEPEGMDRLFPEDILEEYLRIVENCE